MPTLAERDTKSNSQLSELEMFEKFCADHLRLEDGSPLVLEPFQKRMLADYFDGTRETLIIISKKNGKSTIVGALSLFHLVTTPNAEGIVVAAAREQAAILFGQAAGFVERSSWLQERIKPTLRELRSTTDRGRIRVMASDANTGDGVIPTLAVVDELGRHKSPELYSILRDGLVPRGGQLIAISTAGDDEESALGEMRKQAHDLKHVEVDGAHTYARSKNGSFVLHEWALKPEDDREDMEVVKTANPASWQTVEDLKERFDSPSMVPWAWARFTCGVWLMGEESAISELEWNACAMPDLTIAAGTEEVFVGVDFAWKWDSTAIVPCWSEKRPVTRPSTVLFQGVAPPPAAIDGDPTIYVHPPTILTPPQDGTSLDHEEVFAALAACKERWPTVTFVIDPNASGAQMAQRIDRELGADVIEYSQMPKAMSAASQALLEKIAKKEIRHPDDPDLNRHVLGAAAKFEQDAWRFVKQKKGKFPIDGVIALSMAVRMIETYEFTPKPTIYFT